MSTENAGETAPKIDKSRHTVGIPDGVKVQMSRGIMRVEGPLGRTFRSFKKIPVDIDVGEGSINLKARGTRKRDYAILNTARSIVRNLCEGVRDGYTVKMRVVYAHFPITVKVDGRTVMIENFQGERSARTAKIIGTAKVAAKGEEVLVTGPVLTDVTQTAANIAQHTKVKNKDHRVFLDGIYIEEKRKGSG